MLRNLLVGLIALTLVAPVASADAVDPGDTELDFGLTDMQDQGVSGARSMIAEDPAAGDNVAVGDGTLWVADEPAEVALDVDAQTVNVHLTFAELSSVQSVSVQVGVWNDTDGFESHGTASSTADDLLVGTNEEFAVDVSAHTIEVDERPAIRVDATLLDSVTGEALVDTGNSQVHYTSSSPSNNYPTPEIGSLLLSGVGLLGVLGIARFRLD